MRNLLKYTLGLPIMIVISLLLFTVTTVGFIYCGLVYIAGGDLMGDNPGKYFVNGMCELWEPRERD